jgi:hypothetical protein
MICLGALTWTSPAAGQEKVVSPHGQLPKDLDCSTCHTAEGWRKLRTPLGFDHSRSGFVLSGVHARTACAQCHLDLRFDGPAIAQNDCGSCHVDVHEGRMLQSCSECHTTSSFDDVDGELVHARTSFPLTGAHRQVTCEACHTNDEGGAFTALPTDCVSCHEADYQNAKTVDHVANGYPTDCTRCHTTMAWGDSPAFDHASVSGGFALVGAHTRLRCASCHQVPGMQPLFSPASQDDCVACHQADYDRQHGGSAFPTTCVSCHNVNSWGDANFDHAATGFPLVGAHSSLDCATCHAASHNLASLPSGPDDCVACHQADYDGVHAGSGIPTTCSACHTTSSWDGATADHAALSGGFTLTGRHATAQCTACHVVPGYSLKFSTPSSEDDCVTCHLADYNRAHSGNTRTTCADCHNTSRWGDEPQPVALLGHHIALVGRP